MVGAGFYVVLFFSFHLDFSLVALHTPSYILLCSPLSYKCNFPSKTSSLKHYHLCKVVLNMHLCLFCSYSLLFFNLLAVVPYAWFMASSHLDRYWSCDVTLSTFRLWSKIKSIGRRILHPNNKWYGNIQWSCALCSCKRKSGYSCSPSRLYSLYLLRFSR